MTDLDDQLLAQGGACEHLAKLFAHKRGMAKSGFPCPPLSTTPWTDALTQLLARIAEMEAERERNIEDIVAARQAALDDSIARVNAEAALAERDRMLRLWWDEGGRYAGRTFEQYLVDLRARAEEEEPKTQEALFHRIAEQMVAEVTGCAGEGSGS